jgi:hypothetical protein
MKLGLMGRSVFKSLLALGAELDIEEWGDISEKKFKI